jgi:hypothetical protein
MDTTCLRGERCWVGVAPPNSLQPTCHHGGLRSIVEIAELASNMGEILKRNPLIGQVRLKLKKSQDD